MQWPGKADCFRTIQQPSIATLIPDREQSVEFDTTQHLFIEGDNLEVLKLLQKSYLGKVKMIYIDPPYNTGKEFIYPDNYSESLETYLSYTSQTDDQGRRWATNSDTDGRYHSKWMSMMYPRLFLAKNLLREDGVIFISIDDHEMNNLRKICDEIFGEENFIASIIIQANPRGRQSDNFIATLHDYAICYSKNKEMLELGGLPLTKEDVEEFDQIDNDGKKWRELGLRQRGSASLRTERPEMFFPIYVNPNDFSISLEKSKTHSISVIPKKSNGVEGRWMWGKLKVKNESNRVYGRLINKRNEFEVFIKDYLEKNDEVRTKKAKSIWSDKDVNTEHGGKLLKKLLSISGFSYPKPIGLLSKLLILAASDTDIILDFFAGSATTAHAVLDLNKEDGGTRKFICVQIPEPTDVDSEAYKAGYHTIADISKERIRRVIQNIQTEIRDKKAKEDASLFGNESHQAQQDLGFKVFKLAASNFDLWDSTPDRDPSTLEKNLFDHVHHLLGTAAQEAILYEIILKAGFELNTPIVKHDIHGHTVYNIQDGGLYICLDKSLDHDTLKAIAERQPVRFICLDEAFGGDDADALKTNAVQIMKSKDVVFRTV